MRLNSIGNKYPKHILSKIKKAKKTQQDKLSLSQESLFQIPSEVFGLEQIKELTLTANMLEDIPGDVGKLKNLTHLHLSHNRINTFSSEIANLDNLTHLSLNYNHLKFVPEDITKLLALTHLHLSNNELRTLPNSIVNLENLKYLNLRQNCLDTIPDVIFKLPSLEILILGNNNIEEIYSKILNLKKLKVINIENNPIQTPPVEICNADDDGNGNILKIMNYFKQIKEQGSESIYEAKLLVLGEPGAGKTTLSNKIINPDYELDDKGKSTSGVDIIKWLFPTQIGNDFQVNIWDFGGQEIYHSTHQFFLTKRSLYALVADSRSENTDFYYWLNIIDLLSNGSPLLIIKNEKQERKREINEKQLRAEFPNYINCLTTNLATNRGLDAILDEVKYQINKLPHIGSILPKKWVQVRETLDNDSRNYIDFNEYLNICHNNGFTIEKDKLQLSEYLHDLGVFIHFQDDPILKKIVILKPKWGTDAVYKLLDNDHVIHNRGKFNKEDLSNIWHEKEYVAMRDELLQLMLNFHLCYRIENNCFIAPQLLLANQPYYDWDGIGNLQLRYAYEFMPKGILSRFIVTMHKFILDQKKVWKTGVLLGKDQAIGEVIENYNKREIKVRISGEGKKELKTIIMHELEKIHATYKRLKVKKLVPCNCEDYCKNSQMPEYFSEDDLKNAKKFGKGKIQCRKSFKDVFVEDITEETNKKAITVGNEIFISYSWGGESEVVANKLYNAFKKRKVDIILDKIEIAYKGQIKKFMQRMGAGKCIIVIISKDYLESPNCMFELVQIAKHGEFFKRIFPVVLGNSEIYNAVQRARYVRFWDKKVKELEKEMEGLSPAYFDGLQEDLNIYYEIRFTFSKLTDIIKNMNTFNPEYHNKTGFADLIKSVKNIIKE